MIVSLKTDQEIARLFQEDPYTYLDGFTGRIKNDLFAAIKHEVDNLNKSGREIEGIKKIVVSEDKQKSILDDFALSLLYDIDSYLHPRGVVRVDNEDEQTEYIIVSSSDLPVAAPEREQPDLGIWVKVKEMKYYVQAKIIVNGIMERELPIVTAFVKGKEEPTLIPLLSFFVFIYDIAKVELTTRREAIESVAGALISALTGDDKIRQTVENYRFEGPILTYFKKSVLRGFFYEYVGIYPNYTQLKADRYLRDQIKEMGYSRMEITELMQMLPPRTVRKDDIEKDIDSEEIFIEAAEPDKFSSDAYVQLLERLFREAEKKHLEKYIEFFKLELEKIQGLRAGYESIADELKISVSNVRKRKCEGKREFRKLARAFKNEYI